jgi:hypothetical protein
MFPRWVGGWLREWRGWGVGGGGSYVVHGTHLLGLQSYEGRFETNQWAEIVDGFSQAGGLAPWALCKLFMG